MSAASSEATEQLVTSAKATLLQVQTILVTQSDEGASRLRDAQISFITMRRERSSSTSASHEKEIHLVMATPLHRPPFVAAYGVAMSEMTVRGFSL